MDKQVASKRVVAMNSRVQVHFHDGKICTLKVLPVSNFELGVVSALSPVGSAILGAKVNDIREYFVKGELRTLTILGIE